MDRQGIFRFARRQTEGTAYLTFHFFLSVPVRHTNLYLPVRLYALRVHILSKGQYSYSPFPSPLFQSQVGHSLIRQLPSPLSPKMNCMHYGVMRQCYCRGLSIKKAESYYLHFIYCLHGDLTWSLGAVSRL